MSHTCHHDTESRNQIWWVADWVWSATVKPADAGDHGAAGLERVGDRAEKNGGGNRAGKSAEAGGLDKTAAEVF
jgi:hypothetical protein